MSSCTRYFCLVMKVLSCQSAESKGEDEADDVAENAVEEEEVCSRVFQGVIRSAHMRCLVGCVQCSTSRG
jgi:hypothetical protein